MFTSFRGSEMSTRGGDSEEEEEEEEESPIVRMFTSQNLFHSKLHDDDDIQSIASDESGWSITSEDILQEVKMRERPRDGDRRNKYAMKQSQATHSSNAHKRSSNHHLEIGGAAAIPSSVENAMVHHQAPSTNPVKPPLPPLLAAAQLTNGKKQISKRNPASISTGLLNRARRISQGALNMTHLLKDVHGNDRIAALFRKFDTDHSGSIDFKEFQHLAHAACGEWLNDQQSREIIASLDADCNGTIDLDEFRQWFKQFELEQQNKDKSKRVAENAENAEHTTNNKKNITIPSPGSSSNDISSGYNYEEVHQFSRDGNRLPLPSSYKHQLSPTIGQSMSRQKYGYHSSPAAAAATTTTTTTTLPICSYVMQRYITTNKYENEKFRRDEEEKRIRYNKKKNKKKTLSPHQGSVESDLIKPRRGAYGVGIGNANLNHGSRRSSNRYSHQHQINQRRKYRLDQHSPNEKEAERWMKEESRRRRKRRKEKLKNMGRGDDKQQHQRQQRQQHSSIPICRFDQDRFLTQQQQQQQQQQHAILLNDEDIDNIFEEAGYLQYKKKCKAALTLQRIWRGRNDRVKKVVAEKKKLKLKLIDEERKQLEEKLKLIESRKLKKINDKKNRMILKQLEYDREWGSKIIVRVIFNYVMCKESKLYAKHLRNHRDTVIDSDSDSDSSDSDSSDATEKGGLFKQPLKEVAAEVIQAVARGYLKRKKIKPIYKLKSAAQIAIARQYRGRSNRIKANALRLEKYGEVVKFTPLPVNTFGDQSWRKQLKRLRVQVNVDTKSNSQHYQHSLYQQERSQDLKREKKTMSEKYEKVKNDGEKDDEEEEKEDYVTNTTLLPSTSSTKVSNDVETTAHAMIYEEGAGWVQTNATQIVRDMNNREVERVRQEEQKQERTAQLERALQSATL